MRKFLLVSIILLNLQELRACDICGESSGNYFIGLLPQFRKHFFGMRYSFRRFSSRLASDHSQFSNDFYQTAELWGGVNLGRKWQVMGFIPYNLNRQVSDDGTKHSRGLGDVSVLANYKLFDKRSEGKFGALVGQQLWIGGGVKLPTGKFAAEPDEIIPDANNQAGTGSLDFLLNAMYSYHRNGWGINSNVNYKINRSAKDFQFGNRLSASAFVFHSIMTRKITFNPNAGLLFEDLEANKLSDTKIDQTGGHALLAAGGLETIFRKTIVGFNAQVPISQRMSDGQTTTKLRGMLHITFVF
jgi:hypothetical protein